MNAANFDFSPFPIKASEFPAGVLNHMEHGIIALLCDLRVAAGVPFIPSPIRGAHIRDSGNSQHSIKGGTRLSTATDFYVSWKSARAVYDLLLADPRVKGLGIYTDMMLYGVQGDMCMFHIDTRPNQLRWVGWRPDTKTPLRYVYNQAEMDRILTERAKW